MTRGWLQRVGHDRDTFERRHSSVVRFRSELARMNAARSIGSIDGDFLVPETIAENEDELSFKVRVVAGFMPLAQRVGGANDPESDFRRAGLALGLVHRARFECGSDAAPLFHGDFDLWNVGVDASGRLVLIDWDPAPGLESSNLSMQARDIGLFQFSVVACAVVQLRPSHWVRRQLDAFRSGYLSTMPSADVWPSNAASCVLSLLCAWRNVPPGPIHVRVYRWMVRNCGKLIYGRTIAIDQTAR